MHLVTHIRSFPCQRSHSETTGGWKCLTELMGRIREARVAAIFTTAPIRVGGAAVRGKNRAKIPAANPDGVQICPDAESSEEHEIRARTSRI